MWRTGFVDVLDETGPWIVFGLAVAALMATELDPDGLASLPNSIQLPLFALIGLPVYVCASGATPLVAVLIALGVSPGAALVFLLTGPAMNVTTFGVLTKLHGRRGDQLRGVGGAGRAGDGRRGHPTRYRLALPEFVATDASTSTCWSGSV